MVETRLSALGGDLDRIEDAVLAGHASLEAFPLGPLRRELSRHHREFAGLRSALSRTARLGGVDSPLAAHLPALLQEVEDFLSGCPPIFR